MSVSARSRRCSAPRGGPDVGDERGGLAVVGGQYVDDVLVGEGGLRRAGPLACGRDRSGARCDRSDPCRGSLGGDAGLAAVALGEDRVLDAWRPGPQVAADVTAPGARLGAPGLDELLEPLEVGLGLAFDDAERVTSLLDHTLRLVLQVQGDQRVVGAGRCEVHRAGVRRPGDGGPGDLLVGYLFEDRRVPLPPDAGDLGDPVECRVVDLGDLVHAAHELGELLELGPLVVGGPQGDTHLDGLLDLCRHSGIPLVAGLLCRSCLRCRTHRARRHAHPA